MILRAVWIIQDTIIYVMLTCIMHGIVIVSWHKPISQRLLLRHVYLHDDVDCSLTINDAHVVFSNIFQLAFFVPHIRMSRHMSLYIIDDELPVPCFFLLSHG